MRKTFGRKSDFLFFCFSAFLLSRCPPVLILTVLHGPDKGKRFELPDHEPQLIGRSSEAIPIADQTISRRHCELTPDNGRWYINDLESSNGTYVNGLRVIARRRLEAGDQIRTGN